MENIKINAHNNLYPNTRDYTQIQFIFPVEFEEKVKNSTSDVFSYVKTFKTVVGGLNLEKYLPRKISCGREGYSYRSLLEIVLFSYSLGIYSLRDMADACQTDIRFMYISGNITPSHMTLCRFIKDELKDDIKDIFVEVNTYIENHDVLDTDTIYIDGTKLEANATKFSFVWKKATIKYQEKLFLKFTHSINELRIFYKECNIDIPLYTKEKYKVEDFLYVFENLKVIKQNVGVPFKYGIGHRKEEFQKFYETFEEMTSKAIDYADKIRICGNRNSYSKTDHDATMMHGKEDYYMKTGIFRAYYNVQVGVSNEYIRWIDVFQNPSDIHTFQPFLEAFHREYGQYPKYPVADAGYGSFANYKYCQEHAMELVQKYAMYSKENESTYCKNQFNSYNYRRDEDGNYYCPNNCMFEFKGETETICGGYRRTSKNYVVNKCEECPLREKCHSSNKKDHSFKSFEVCDEWNEMKAKVNENLKSELGITQRVRRSIEAEGTFGIIKQDWDYNRIHRRGIKNVQLEMLLVATGFNLMKFHMRTVVRKLAS